MYGVNGIAVDLDTGKLIKDPLVHAAGSVSCEFSLDELWHPSYRNGVYQARVQASRVISDCLGNEMIEVTYLKTGLRFRYNRSYTQIQLITKNFRSILRFIGDKFWDTDNHVLAEFHCDEDKLQSSTNILCSVGYINEYLVAVIKTTAQYIMFFVFDCNGNVKTIHVEPWIQFADFDVKIEIKQEYIDKALNAKLMLAM